MSVANPIRGLVPVGTFSTHGDGSPAAEYMCAVNSGLSTVNGWPVANTALFMPVIFPPCPLAGALWPVRSINWQPGTPSGNIDVGLYDAAGTRLYSAGSTAQSNASALQSVSPTLNLTGGLYYIAMAADNITGLIAHMGSSAAALAPALRACGVFRQTSAFPLPSTVTVGGAAPTIDYLPWVFLGMQSVL